VPESTTDALKTELTDETVPEPTKDALKTELTDDTKVKSQAISSKAKDTTVPKPTTHALKTEWADETKAEDEEDHKNIRRDLLKKTNRSDDWVHQVKTRLDKIKQATKHLPKFFESEQKGLSNTFTRTWMDLFHKRNGLLSVGIQERYVVRVADLVRPYPFPL
jgi:adenylate kinase family enzyme